MHVSLHCFIQVSSWFNNIITRQVTQLCLHHLWCLIVRLLFLFSLLFDILNLIPFEWRFNVNVLYHIQLFLVLYFMCFPIRYCLIFSTTENQLQQNSSSSEAAKFCRSWNYNVSACLTRIDVSNTRLAIWKMKVQMKYFIYQFSYHYLIVINSSNQSSYLMVLKNSQYVSQSLPR